MNPVIYQRPGFLISGEYLPGQYRWPFDVRLSTALLDGESPAEGVLTLSVEIGGGLTPVFTVPASGHVVLQRPVNLLVPANTWVRWRGDFTGPPEAAANNVAITLHAVPQSIAGVATLPPPLTLQWHNGLERFVLFNYAPATHTFTEDQPGIASGRAILTQTGDASFSLALQALEKMRVASENFYLEELIEGTASRSALFPRLVFCAGPFPCATITPLGFFTRTFTEADPEILLPADLDFHNRFEFYSGGQLTAVLDVNGLTATELIEPLP